MTDKMTPGPWRVSKHLRSRIAVLTVSTDADVCHVPLSPYVDNTRRHADAAAIAALPDLIEAAKELVNNVNGLDDNSPDHELIFVSVGEARALRAALVKAGVDV